MQRNKRLGKWLAGGVTTVVCAISIGCLARPVGTQSPTTKVNFTSNVSQQAVDKVDILFAIDNSGSMLDKQKILADAVPNLLSGLLQPRCLDTTSGAAVGKTADPNGNKDNNFNCPAGSKPEFTPVTDMHIGVISSSLGTMGGNICVESALRADDHGHLLGSTDPSSDAPLADASPSNFLSWFPSNQTNSDTTRHPPPPTPAITSFDALKTDFQKLVTGVGQSGCGLEAQLESVYHFLIAPDPWKAVTVQDGLASYGTDVDFDLLKQRADFLRPDSLVAIILLSDEDDSSADPMSIGGQGWNFMNGSFIGSTQVRQGRGQGGAVQSTAPRPTSVCAKNPLADGKDGSLPCTSCAFGKQCKPGDALCPRIAQDPNCQKTDGYYTPEEESPNTRFVRMKERFGVDPQYPISRYTDGLTKATVPDRASEHPGNGDYVGTPKCTNPLFAKTLPRAPGEDLCTRTRGNRSADLIFFAVVGGVPNALLHFDATDPDKNKLSDDDWGKILGKDPLHFDYSNIDPHMVQSITPRAGVPPPSATPGDNGSPTDPVGRDWDTKGADLQYACTFALPVASQTVDRVNGDCKDGQNPPLCGTTAGQQIRAKAYPTVRELEVVRALGEQGIAASLCPISLSDPADPTYGYNPAVISIIERLRNALTTQCLPQKLTRDETNEVPCLVLATLGDVSDSCKAHDGLADVDPEILAKFREAQKAASGDTNDAGATDLTKLPVCQLKQLPPDPGSGTCANEANNGWCYVENSGAQQPAGRCPQAVIFSSGTASLQGATFNLQCIQQFTVEAGAGGP